MTGHSSVLEVRELSKSYRRRPVLRELSVTVEPGEAVAVIGPNGAGKSTFLGCVTGERLPDSGAVRICGHDPVSDPARVAECMGFVPEQPFLYGELTVAETLRFIGEIRRMDRALAEGETSRLLSRLGLAGAEGTFCRELSQGMARKVAVIAAMLHRPRLLVLDEAFNGLDLPSAEMLLAELDARREAGASVLLSSHDLTLLASWCDRGLLLAPHEWSTLDGEEWQRWKRAPALPSVGSASHG